MPQTDEKLLCHVPGNILASQARAENKSDEVPEFLGLIL